MGKTVNLSVAIQKNPDMTVEEIMASAKEQGVNIVKDTLNDVPKVAPAPVAKEKPFTYGGNVLDMLKDMAMSVPERAKKAVNASTDKSQSIPSRIYQTVAQPFGLIGDIGFQGLEHAGKAITQPIPDAVKNLVSKGGAAVAESAPAQSILSYISELAAQHPEATKNIVATGDIAAGLPFIGAPLEAGGEALLKGGMKISKKIGTKVGKGDVAAGKAETIGRISDYGTESVKGYRGIADKTQKVIEKNMDAVDRIAEVASANPSVPLINAEKVYADMTANISKGFKSSEKDKAEKAMAGIIDRLQRDGYTGDLTVKQVNEAKRAISGGTDIAPKGITADDILSRKVDLKASLAMRDAMDEVVPEIKKFNKAVHENIPVKQAAEEAQARIDNYGLMGGIPGAIAGGSGMIDLAKGDITGAMQSLAAMAAIGGGRKVFGGGKIPSAMIKAGRALQLKGTPKDISAKEVQRIIDKYATQGSIIPKNAVPFMDQERLIPTPEKFSTEALKKKGSLGDLLSNQRGEVAAFNENLIDATPLSNGKFVAYDPIRKERIYSKGTTARQFDTEQDAISYVKKLLKDKYGINTNGSALSPVLPATAGLSAAGLAAIQAINNMSNKGVSK